jgi:hypothetical protein
MFPSDIATELADQMGIVWGSQISEETEAVFQQAESDGQAQGFLLWFLECAM